MTITTIAQAQDALNGAGFPCGPSDGVAGPRTRAAVIRYQSAWAGLYGAPGYEWLAVDGILGPATMRCLGQLPHLSWHFAVDELRSHGTAADGNCYVRRELVAALEVYRTHLGGLAILDAYRNPAHNDAVGGAHDSMHLYGLAADVAHPDTVQDCYGLQLFSGIGDKDNLVAHIDLRHLAGTLNHTPGATPANPARWHY